MSLPPWKKPWLNGRCFDFALALAERLDNPTFVAVGDPDFPHHIGIKIGNIYLDVRGILDENDFLAHHKDCGVTIVEHDLVALHCGLAGVEPPYQGNTDIEQARQAVDDVFPDDVLDTILDSLHDAQVTGEAKIV